MKEKLVCAFVRMPVNRRNMIPVNHTFFLSFTGCNVYLSGRWETD